MAALAGVGEDPATAIATAICLAAIAVKAAVFPVHGWLAITYAAASPAVAALFSGPHTKIAVYVVYLINAVIFEGHSAWMLTILIFASLTLVIGAFAALGENNMRSLMIFQIVSGIAFILSGISLFTPLGLTSGIPYYGSPHDCYGGHCRLRVAAIEHTLPARGAFDLVLGIESTRENLKRAPSVIGIPLACTDFYRFLGFSR
jgi:Formate hydrogenlyase subunit 3/Multisubunit Na+/H+ antiporter, MnhD subunit